MTTTNRGEKLDPSIDPTTARQLTNDLRELLRRERHTMADFLLALADFDRDRRWLALGHASLFSFLRRELGLSAGAAQYRKTAAELVRHHPAVETALREGMLCLSSVIELAKVVTDENAPSVLPRFYGLSSRDAAAVAAELRPVENAPDREVVRFTAVARPTPPTTPALAFRAPEAPIDGAHPTSTAVAAIAVSAPATVHPEIGGGAAAGADLRAGAPATPAPERPRVEPLDAGRARLHVTVSRRFLSKLEQARAALSHAQPRAGAEEVLEAALDALLRERAKRRGGLPRASRHAPAPTEVPSTTPGSAASVPPAVPIDPPAIPLHPPAVATRAARPTIPAAVRRAVWARSGGCCEWPLESGGVCGSTLRLELDHVRPVALGGGSSVEDLRVACRVHNQHAAREKLGTWVDRYRRRPKPSSAGEANPSRDRSARVS